MKFSVPTNWQDDLIPKIKKEGVDELYGKLASDYIGGGRPSFMLPHISRKQVSIHIQKAHENGLRFNYLLNALCLDNREFTISGQRKIHKLLDWLLACKVDSVTVSIPYLLQLIKKQYPQFKVCISTMAEINTAERAKYWEDLGADAITLYSPTISRNFQLLKEIKKNLKCRIQLIGNNGCLYNCPFSIYDYLISSHASQFWHESKGFMIPYCIISCRYLRLTDFINFIRADWIRPEDIHYYEDIGIDTIKLTERSSSTGFIAKTVNAYSRRFYDGNLLDIVSPLSGENITQQGNTVVTLFYRLRYFFRPFSINIFRLFRLLKTLPQINAYIDNRMLDGFLEYFVKGNCNLNSCQDCDYCREVARKVVKIDSSRCSIIIKQYERILNDLLSGKIFKYI